jgi:hypothetical protein
LQGNEYIKYEADKWFDRNTGCMHNSFTEYLLALFSKRDIRRFDIAEFGIGRANNINILSHFANKVDGYDGSKQSINMLTLLHKRNPKINGKRVNLADTFQPTNNYNIIIYGFFTYMITEKEFSRLVDNSKHMLKNEGYIYIFMTFYQERTILLKIYTIRI